jgi:hypothetical protein
VGGALERHLREWLGAWPPAGDLEVVGCDQRRQTGWNGRLHPLVAVVGPAGAVVSVPPDAVTAVEGVLAGQIDRAPSACAHASRERWLATRAAAVGAPGRTLTN